MGEERTIRVGSYDGGPLLPSLPSGNDEFNAADAYYTSPIGMKELGYMGNGAMASFSVPKEAMDYAIRRSPLA